MKYAIDKIEDNIVILENLETKEKGEISKENIIGEVHEGAIIIKENNIYKTRQTEEELRRKLLREKLEHLKKKQP